MNFKDALKYAIENNKPNLHITSFKYAMAGGVPLSGQQSGQQSTFLTNIVQAQGYSWKILDEEMFQKLKSLVESSHAEERREGRDLNLTIKQILNTPTLEQLPGTKNFVPVYFQNTERQDRYNIYFGRVILIVSPDWQKIITVMKNIKWEKHQRQQRQQQEQQQEKRREERKQQREKEQIEKDRKKQQREKDRKKQQRGDKDRKKQQRGDKGEVGGKWRKGGKGKGKEKGRKGRNK